MRPSAPQHRPDYFAGFSLVEALVVAALSAAIFGALFSSFYFSLELVSDSRSRLAAMSLAQERMEYFRSLPYNDVGTIGGIPPGSIPQQSTSTYNGLTFRERVLVEYVDDPGDGKLTATTTDSNGIPNDYKRAKIEVTWNVGETSTSSITLVSNIVPPSIESNVGGGTVWVNVFGENSQPIEDAAVRLLNDTTTTTIDITRFTDSQGIAMFSGAPATSSYQTFVSKPDHSSAQTYIASSSNPNPTEVPYGVAEADIAVKDFQIDKLSDLTLFTRSGISEGVDREPFGNLDAVATSTRVDTALGGLVLADTAGVYASNGTAFLEPVAPSPLLGWDILSIAADTPVGTEALVRLYTGSATTSYTPIPDAHLPGNPLGFTGPIIDVSALDRVDYPAVTVGIELETTNTAETPRVDEVALYYREDVSLLGSVPVTVTSDDLIGTLPDIPRFSESRTTSATGRSDFDDMKFDRYTVTLPASNDVARACPDNPFTLHAGTDMAVEFVLVPNSANSLRVQVTTGAERLPVPGAEVALGRGGATTTETTNNCGQAYFGGVADANDYRVETSAPGFDDAVFAPYTISGDAVLRQTLLPE